jgi:hypothetical protein
VIRASHLNDAVIPAGERFSFDLHCFGEDRKIVESFKPAFYSWAENGLGATRGHVHIAGIERLGRDRKPTQLDFPIHIDLAEDREILAINRILVEFKTPTELKQSGEMVRRPEFPILFARLRDRIGALSTFYAETLGHTVNFGALAEQAGEIHLSDCSLRWLSSERRSSRTGQVHPLGGFIGTATYEGNLAPFLAWLEAGYWSGVGRQTVWGKGVIDVTPL